MTRKHYAAIAAAIWSAIEEASDGWDACTVAANNIADVLAADNPRFDRDTFIQAATWHPAKRRKGSV